MNINYHLLGYCFVYVQGNEVDMDKYHDLVNLSKAEEIILYPERRMCFVDQVTYIPYVKSVVTENPWIISCYPKQYVWRIIDGQWEHPEEQTFGASVEYITSNLLNYSHTIPMAIVSGKEGILEYRKKVKNNSF